MLLRRFAVPGTRDRSVAVFDADTSRLIPQASIRGQCAESFLYGENGIIEDTLSRLEGAAASAIAEIVKSRQPLQVGDKQWEALLQFVVVQIGRTPAAGHAMAEKLRGLARQATRASRGRTSVPEPEVSLSQSIRDTLKSVWNSAPVIADLDDIVIVNESDIEFVVSDLGVTLYNQWGQDVEGVGTTGLACHGLQIFIPLSPRHLLIKYDASVYRTCGNQKVSSTVTKDTSGVKAVNYFHMVTAERCLYFSGHSNTTNSLLGLRKNICRAPLSSLIRVNLFEAGERNLVSVASENLNLRLRLPWLTIRKSAARIPVKERGMMLRPEAQEIVRQQMRGPRRPNPLGPEPVVFRPFRD